MSRAANEAEVILPAHWKGHVLRCEIQAAVLIPCAHQHQRRNHEAAVPDWFAGVQLYDLTSGRFVHDAHLGT